MIAPGQLRLNHIMSVDGMMFSSYDWRGDIESTGLIRSGEIFFVLAHLPDDKEAYVIAKDGCGWIGVGWIKQCTSVV